MRKLIEMKSKMYNTPHLIEMQNFNWVEGVVNAQHESPQLAISGKEKNKERHLSYNPDTRVGMIGVQGPLTYQEYEAVCGEANTSYQGIQTQFDKLVEAGAKTIVLDVDSPGGEAFGMMETGRYMRKMADKHNIKMISYVDGLAASAGYGLAAAAHEVIANPGAELGSIGVVVKLRNINKAMKAMGVEDTYIFAGESKIPFTPEGDFAKEFLDDVQEKVSALYTEFTAYVAELQNISVDAVKATEAKTFLAAKAQEIGLATKIMTRESFFEYLADVVQNGDTMLRSKLFGKTEEKKMSAEELAKMATLEAQLAELTASVEGKAAELTAALAAVEEKNAALEAANAALAEANEKLAAVAQAEADALAKAEAERVAARKASLVEAVGEAEAETLYAALSALDDASFAAVVGKMNAKTDLEAGNPAFMEVGRAGDKGIQVPVDPLAKMLDEKYGPKAN